MAQKGYVDQLINALPSDLRYPLTQAFHYVMDSWRLGTAAKAENAQLFRVSGITHGTANTEFSVKHGLDSVPTQIVPILDLSVVNSQLVPLQVSRAADLDRIYLKSSSTNAAFVVLVEP